MSFLTKHPTITRYVIVSGARTGSSLLQYILWPFCRSYFYEAALGELLLGRNWIYDTGKGIARIRLTHDQERKLEISEGVLVRQRLDLIEKYQHQKYLFKLYPWFLKHAKENQLTNLFDNFHFILIDRHNTREMALSHTIAMNSELYTIRYPHEVQDMVQGVFIPESHGAVIRDTYDSFQSAKIEIKNRAKHVHEVWYEDILKYENPYQFLTELGVRNWEHLILPQDKLPHRIASLIDKESMIDNIEDFNTWCLANGFVK